MKLAIASNYRTAHTEPLCQALYACLGDGFAFVETVSRASDPSSQTRGYAFQTAPEQDAPWVIRAWRSPEEADKARAVLRDFDAVLTMNVDDRWLRPRLRAGKLTLRAHERWYRQPLPRHKRLRARIGGWLHHGRFANLHLLCASAYTAADAHIAGCFRGKAYQWGYFPEFLPQPPHKDNGIPAVLWAGRMISLKHPEDALRACQLLWRAGYRFRLKMVGDGPMEEQLKNMAEAAPGNVEFSGALPSKQLRQVMADSHIFLFTSDRREGWGVVVNEAMNAGCAVVASHQAGCVPSLLRHGENGLIYPDGDVEALADCIRQLLESPVSCTRLGVQAYRTIRDGWTPQIAAQRLIRLCRTLSDGTVSMPEQGLCAPAQVLSDDWFLNL